MDRPNKVTTSLDGHYFFFLVEIVFFYLKLSRRYLGFVFCFIILSFLSVESYE